MRRCIIATISILIVLLQATFCFAGNLEIVNSYPHDGGTGFQPVNLAVKLYFNQDVLNSANQEANKDCFKITGPDNKSQPITVLYVPKEEGLVEVVLKNTLEEDTEYKLTISGEFMASSGDTLGSDQTITFRTRSTKNDMKINMVMMGVMFVGIMFFSSRQMKHQMKKDAEEKEKEEKVNPYKVSKETGKSVQEIVKKTEKQKQKKALEEAKRKENLEKEEQNPSHEDERDNGNKKVKGPRPILAGGSVYLSGRKAKAEKEAKKLAEARAAGTTRPKNQKGKSKNKKK